MKTCAYCGRENGDEAEYCMGCGTQFLAPPTVPISMDCGLQVAALPAPPADSATAPEQQWRASEAWKCFGILVLFKELLGFWVWELDLWFPHFRHWQYTGIGYLVLSLIQFGVYIGTVLYFARTESWASFMKAFGLSDSPSPYVWFGVTAALAIRGFGHALISSGLAHGVTTIDQSGFRHSVGVQRFFFLVPALLLAPTIEELCMRGFLYRAFRGSYSIFFSTGLIVGLTALTHSGQFRQSWVAVVGISLLTVLQCFLRERGNLRDSMIVHFVFNASAAVLNSLHSH